MEREIDGEREREIERTWSSFTEKKFIEGCLSAVWRRGQLSVGLSDPQRQHTHSSIVDETSGEKGGCSGGLTSSTASEEFTFLTLSQSLTTTLSDFGDDF